MEHFYAILAVIWSFIFWYMLSVQMQNDMYKELIKQIDQCRIISNI